MEISSLMDGELDAREAERTIRNCCGSEELKRKWLAYHLIGDALRGEGPRQALSAQRIIDALRDEPTVLAPRWRTPVRAARIAFAAAASLATVAVVAWIGMQDRVTHTGPAVASAAKSAPAQAARTLVVNVVPLTNVNEYVVVHRQVPNADFYRLASDQSAVGR